MAIEKTKMPKLDGNTFFIFSYKYPQAKLMQLGSKGNFDVGTHEQDTWPSQLWNLEESKEHAGYYYINNANYQGYRLRKFGSSYKNIGVYNGQYYDNQLWRFEVNEDKLYRIYNFEYKNDKIAKFKKGDVDLGTDDGSLNDDQLWRLVPRFEAKAQEIEIWAIDNRQGSQPVSKEFTITTGVKLSTSATLSTKFGFEESLTESLTAIKGVTPGMESTQKFSFEISASITGSEEKTWSKETKTTYTAPAGKKYRVLQTVLSFNSDLNEDNCALYCTERIEEN